MSDAPTLVYVRNWCRVPKMFLSSKYQGTTVLNGLHRKHHEIGDEANFLLNKRLSVSHSCEKAVVSRSREGAFTNLFFGNEERATR